MVSIEQKPEYIRFINEVLDVKFMEGQAMTIASLSNEGEILGVVAYDGFTVHNCELSVASISPRFLNKAFLRAVFHYPFITLGKRRITIIIEDGNEAALTLNRRLGFVDEARLKGWYGDKDGIVLRMLREECNVLEKFKEKSLTCET